MKKREFTIYPGIPEQRFDVGFANEFRATEITFLGLDEPGDYYLNFDLGNSKVIGVPLQEHKFYLEPPYNEYPGIYECQIEQLIDGVFVGLYEPFKFVVNDSKIANTHESEVPYNYEKSFKEMEKARVHSEEVTKSIENKRDAGEFDGQSPTTEIIEGDGTHTIVVTDRDGEHRTEVKDGTVTQEFKDLAAQVHTDADASKEAADSALKTKTSAEETLETANTVKSAIEQTKTDVDGLAKASASSAESASGSASNASTYASNASASAGQASTSAGNASASASDAAGSAKAAQDASTSAEGFASNASTSAEAAKASETNASKSATTAGDKAGEASASAEQSATSAGEAKTSETNAKASETKAKEFADQCNLKVALPMKDGQPVHGQAGDYAISDGKGGVVFVSRSNLIDWEEIRGFVRSGIAKDRYEIGYQFNVPITYNGKIYQVPFHVASYRDIITEAGETKPAMILQPHLLLPMSVQYDEPEAFYEAEGSELPAGTYHVVITNKWGDHVAAGDTYSFTLTKPVPVGGQICGFKHAPYSGVTMNVKVYADAYATEPLETAELIKGANGAKLADLDYPGNECNSFQRTCYGYNRWANSFVRQYLNSHGTGWWKKQNKYDRPGSGASSMVGFLDCVDPEFLSVLGPVKVTTALNTVTDKAEGDREATYDTFFLPSLEEMSINPQLAGAEGNVLDYWNQVSGGQKFPWYKETPELVQLAVDDNRAKYTWLRSASRGYAHYVWFVFPSGYVGSSSATYAYRLAPLCAIY